MKQLKVRILTVDKKLEYKVGHWTIDELNDEKVMLFIGIQDKNGVDIYTGDRLRWVIYDDYWGKEKHQSGIVVYHEKEARFIIKEHPQFEIWRFGDQIEVIGNVYGK